MGSSSSSRSAGAMSCAASPTRPRSPPDSVRHEPRLRLLGVEAEPLQHRVHAGVVDVAAEVGEALLVVPELLQHLVGDLVAQLAQRHRLLGDALLERDDLAPGRGARLPHGGGALEGPVLVEQGMPQPRLARHAPHGGLAVAGDDAEDRRLAGAVAPDDPPPLALGDGEGDVLEELGRAEGDADVGAGEQSHDEGRKAGGFVCRKANAAGAEPTSDVPFGQLDAVSPTPGDHAPWE